MNSKEGYGEKLNFMPLANQNFPEIQGKIARGKTRIFNLMSRLRVNGRHVLYVVEFLDEYE